MGEKNIYLYRCVIDFKGYFSRVLFYRYLVAFVTVT